MSTKLRIATFNLENLDDKPGEQPSLKTRIAVMRPQLIRLNADILCLQEVNGQETSGQRQLLALDKLLETTPYQEYHRATTKTEGGQVYDERNLVILSRFEISEFKQYKHQFAPPLMYRQITAQPAETKAKELTWERPILHAKINLLGNQVLDVINVHLKSKLPTTIAGQKVNDFTWKTASGWAEGSFISAMKRVGQALETRLLIDQLLDANEDALIVICGDFNAEADEVPIEAIRGDVENTGNSQLAKRVMVACERTIPASARFSLLHQGKGTMLDHVLISRSLLTYYQGIEIHNELLHDESLAFATDKLYPESDHAPVIVEFALPDAT
ncbi:endonuclease/exonuclease/phosphatase family protein [Kovacikia minuta CCNUW1]|uniref:endonuclease/exonuclease/phosphatase family protein n=1 Tax=Kovacikia minuta TaxID=2931930 RepID=UPI001CCC4157|nr:endonuclease/exonuclease/phosphatase family protein [Kovacikia minuta]UBF28868.1 endonuclease/exonuclease/phosphatase family protein [Kovacikia minuta CCNUW1]